MSIEVDDGDRSVQLVQGSQDRENLVAFVVSSVLSYVIGWESTVQ